MDLAGNLWEPVVPVGKSFGRVFLGSHGDGELSSAVFATNNDWPGYFWSDDVVNYTQGSGQRGGGFGYDSSGACTVCKTSDRTFAAFDADSQLENRRSPYYPFTGGGNPLVLIGGRFARTAP